MNAIYSVLVGGSEINSHLLTHEQANEIAGYWIGRGYSDVIIKKAGN